MILLVSPADLIQMQRAIFTLFWIVTVVIVLQALIACSVFPQNVAILSNLDKTWSWEDFNDTEERVKRMTLTPARVIATITAGDEEEEETNLSHHQLLKVLLLLSTSGQQRKTMKRGGGCPKIPYQTDEFHKNFPNFEINVGPLFPPLWKELCP